MPRAVGIDLGTTNSVIAYINKNAPKVLENQESEQWTPSVVFAEDRGEFLVGKMAKASGLLSPENMIFSIKRFMGRDFDDDQIKGQIESQRFPYMIEKDQKGEVIVRMRDRYFSPPEVSAIILEALKADAESSLDEQISHAAITVPAYFGTRQKEVTRLAGRLAGLNVLRVLPEPTAAALAFGLDTDMDEPKTVLVYDLGGGTFDVTVMFIGGGTFMDQGKSGDIFLGGDDFDNRIVDRLVKVVQDQHRVDVRTLPNRKEIMLQMKYKAEDAKVRLSRATRSQIIIPGLIRSGGRVIDLEYELERNEFNTLIQDLVKRSIDIVYEGIKKANTTIDDIDSILLVGGSTRVPLVEEEMRRVFGEKVVRKEINPMLCVAQGAAIQTLMVDPAEFESKTDANVVQCNSCGTLNIKGRADCRRCSAKISNDVGIFVPASTPKPTQECPECGAMNVVGSSVCKSCGQELEKMKGELMQKLSKPIGIELDGGALEIILNDDMFLPTEPVTSALHTTKADQRRVVMPVYEGDNPVAKENQYLGRVEGELPPGLPIKTDVNVSIQADIDGTLQVTADVPSVPGVKIQAVLNWKEASADPVSSGTATDGAAPSWQKDGENLRFTAILVCNEGRNLMSSQSIELISQLNQQLELALKIADEANALRIMEQLRPLVQNIFFDVGLAKLVKKDPELPRKIGMQKAEQLAKVLNRLDHLQQTSQGEEYIRVYRAELEDFFNEIWATISKDGGSGDLLGKVSSGTNWGK